MGVRVAVVGVTGAVGTEMLKVLEQRNFPVDYLRPLASSRSVGKKLPFKGDEVTVEELKEDSFGGIDIALFSIPDDQSRHYVPYATGAGAIVIDNSAVFRMDDDVPLVVPEVNADDIEKHKGIIANPNCSTIIMVVPVYPIHRVSRVKRLVASPYQAVSGTGRAAMTELRIQTHQILADEEISPEVYPHQIAFNLLPHIGSFTENAYTTEEMKMHSETRKIFADQEIRIVATTVRVPVFRAHSEALNLELEHALTPDEVRNILSSAPGVKVVDDPSQNLYPLPIDASGQDDVLVGRVRVDYSVPCGISLWVSGDQLLKGAALNAVQIAENLL